ncbi:MAG: phage repressor protein [Bacteroidia bacterium]|jgi:hypothetical protein|nr:phage repressor protein [Bacteroidia bacterium]
MRWKIEKLQRGETFITKEKGNSMTPIIYSNQPHRLAPVKWEDCKPGDIVFCKVRGSMFTHLVIAKDEQRGLQIGNNHGHVNGWTKQVFGIVTEILPFGS